MSLSSEQEPITFREAAKHRCWQEAMKSKIQALKLWFVIRHETLFRRRRM